MNPKNLLDQHHVHPKKSLGQNFVQDPSALDKIVSSAELTPDDTVLEIGPGTGALTERLAQVAKRVIAVELDQRLEPILTTSLGHLRNVEVVYGDILETNVPDLIGGSDYVVVANVPYYITSAILRSLLESRVRPRRIVITVQLEVAERICAQPGDMSVLAVSAQFYGKAQIVGRLKAAIFWPRPEVDSAIVRVDVYEQSPYEVPDEKTFFRVVRAGFSQKRKQLKNSLGEGGGALLAAAGIDPTRRAETLRIDEWAALARAARSELRE
ncbi:MAG: 16S rRNA (adenine(1518)-N(6)/adenine(1519)-N(6))-dimethyltransferase RsmA [Chloroflexota bacterium]